MCAFRNDFQKRVHCATVSVSYPSCRVGVHITLDIQPRRIAPRAWRRAFEETLGLLRAHPSGLIGYDTTEIRGRALCVYTDDIERGKGTDNHRWCVIGDRETLRTAEPQSLYRDLSQYARNARSSPDEILLQISVDEAPGVTNVFGGKTQGEPFHFPLLAAAALIEHRFEGVALVGGNIDRGQAERACGWASEVLGEEISLPVRVDAGALMKRIAPHYEGLALAEAFRQRYLGLQDEVEEILLEALPVHVAEASWLAQMRGYEDPEMLGALRLIIAWLNAGGALTRLCQLSCLEREGPTFPPPRFACALASTWIGIPRGVRSHLDVFQKPKGATETVMSLLGGFLLDMEAVGWRLRVERSLSEIEVAFAAAFGTKGPELFSLFCARSSALERRVVASAVDVERIVARTAVGRRLEDLPEAMSVDQLSEIQKRSLTGMAYGVRRFREQAVRGLPQGASRDEDEDIKSLLVMMSQRSGDTFTEMAWEEIEREETELLKVLLTVGMLNNGPVAWCHLRRAVFERRALRAYVARASQDDALMDAVEVEIERVQGAP